jgi:hypothetical protein
VAHSALLKKSFVGGVSDAGKPGNVNSRSPDRSHRFFGQSRRIAARAAMKWLQIVQEIGRVEISFDLCAVPNDAD